MHNVGLNKSVPTQVAVFVSRIGTNVRDTWVRPFPAGKILPVSGGLDENLTKQILIVSHSTGNSLTNCSRWRREIKAALVINGNPILFL
jgi:hypothetical protein